MATGWINRHDGYPFANRFHCLHRNRYKRRLHNNCNSSCYSNHYASVLHRHAFRQFCVYSHRLHVNCNNAEFVSFRNLFFNYARQSAHNKYFCYLNYSYNNGYDRLYRETIRWRRMPNQYSSHREKSAVFMFVFDHANDRRIGQ
jgi:hypothetical protein